MDNKTLTILIVDDSTEDREAYRRALKRSDPTCEWRFLEADSGAEGLELYTSGHPDCVLLDYGLPDLNGLDLLSILNDASAIAAPVIMLTGQGDERLAVQALKKGARDYLAKDVGGKYRQLLPLVVEQALREQQLLNQRRQAEEALAEYQSHLEQVVEERTRELRLGEARLRAIFEHVADGLLILDRRGEVTFSNPAAQGLLEDGGQGLGRDLFKGLCTPKPSHELEIPDREGNVISLEARAVTIEWEGRTTGVAARYHRAQAQ